MTASSQLLAGIKVEGRVGDYKLYNALVQFCISGTTPISHMTYSGGHLIDADFVGEGTNAVIMWDLETGEEVQRFEGHTFWVRGVDFSPDGTQVISSSGDGTVRLWNVVGGDLFEWIANNRYVRELTPEEREQFRLAP